jgi:hypothetical protein
MVKVKMFFFNLGILRHIISDKPRYQSEHMVGSTVVYDEFPTKKWDKWVWVNRVNTKQPKLAMLFTSQDHDHAENHLIPEGWYRGSIRRCFHLRCKHVLTTCLSAIGLSVYIWTGCKDADCSSCFSLYPDIFSGKKNRGISNSGLEYRY